MAPGLDLRREEVPLHFDHALLGAAVCYPGWPLSAAGMAVGAYLVGTADSFGVEVLGVLLAGSCALLFVALVRCRRYQTVVGTRMLTSGAGPFSRRVPVGFIDRLETRGATSWRRLYSDREVVISLTSGHRPIVVPSEHPEDLVSEMRSARAEQGCG